MIEKGVESSISLGEETVEAIDYLLDSGDTWASRFTFSEPPDSWQAWGFLWARSEIRDLEYECIRDGVQLSFNECNPLNGDEIFSNGNVDPDIKIITDRIVESFKFIYE